MINKIRAIKSAAELMLGGYLCDVALTLKQLAEFGNTGQHSFVDDGATSLGGFDEGFAFSLAQLSRSVSCTGRKTPGACNWTAPNTLIK